MRKRGKYSEEFKREAAVLASNPDIGISQVAHELGINANMLGRWCRELKGMGTKAFQGQGKTRIEGIAQLKRELARVRKDWDFFAGSGGVLREGVEMRYRMIECCREAYPIRLMCRRLKISLSGHYGWRDRPLSARAKDNQRQLDRIQPVHARSDGVMGSPRIWDKLRHEGESCHRHQVARLMRQQGL